MIKKLLVSLLCAVLVASFVLSGFLALYFLMPSRRSASSISLPESVRDTTEHAVAETDTTDETEEETRNTYYADVHEFLTLRDGPASSARQIALLRPFEHMNVLEFVEGTEFAYVEVTSGEFSGQTGYVNSRYITKLGEDPVLAVPEE